MRRNHKIKNFFYTFFIASIVGFITLFFVKELRKDRSIQWTTTPKQQITTGNQKIRNFRAAKKLANRFYQKNHFKTFYCGCDFNRGRIERKSCSYTPVNSRDPRSRRLEWEHVVPISYLGHNISAWKNGHPRCLKKNGKKYKGRRCARLVSKEFNKMEADLYNLVPSVGEVNKLRANFPIGLVEKNQSYAFNCETKIKPGKIEPRDEVKGFLARIYLYMDKAYPGNNLINNRNRSLIET